MTVGAGETMFKDSECIRYRDYCNWDSNRWVKNVKSVKMIFVKCG